MITTRHRGTTGEEIERVRQLGAEIQRNFGRDPRLTMSGKIGLEFLVAMGLLVRDPSDRYGALRESMVFLVTSSEPVER